MATIARHCLIDHVRAQQAGKPAGEQLINADPAGSMVSCLRNWVSICARRASRRLGELIAAIEHAMAAIPKDYRQALQLSYMDQLPVAKVAAKMNSAFRAGNS